MPFVQIKLYPDGRVVRSEQASTWRERQELLAYSLYLQPGLAALDVAARIWRDLAPEGPRSAGGKPKAPPLARGQHREPGP